MVTKPGSGRQNVLGNALIVAGVLLMAWPGWMWAYGQFAQNQLEREFDSAESQVGRGKPTVTRDAGASGPEASASETAASSHTASANAKSHGAKSDYSETTVTKSVAPSVVHSAKSAVKPVKTVGTAAKLADSSHLSTASLSKIMALSAEESKPVQTGHALARLRIPSIDLEAVVVEGAGDSELHKGPGHLPQSAPPGEFGNCVIAGHRAYWFKRLPQVSVGSPVYLETPLWRYQYVVDAKKTVKPNRTDLLNRNDDVRLTLITCNEPTADAPYRELVFCHLKDVTLR